jgi:hypothetical protein
MTKYRVSAAIVGTRDLGIMEANGLREISNKVRLEGLAFEGLCDECFKKLDLEVDEVFIEEVSE